MQKKQYGFSLLLFTLIAGFLLGLIVAACVSFYINNAKAPFMDHFNEQDKIEVPADWNPNATTSMVPGSTVITPVPPPLPSHSETTDNVIADPESGAQTSTGTTTAATTTTAEEAKKQFYVQAGAYTMLDAAETQRAKLAMLGARANIVEFSTSGQTIYRVRTGPFVTRADAESTLQKLKSNGIDASILAS